MRQNVKRFTPVTLQDGSLDPRSLADMGERWVSDWLRDRLAGKDHYLPVDRRSGEDPEALVVGLVRLSGPIHPASRLIGSVAARLLEEGASQSVAPPAFFGALLRLCQQVRLPDTQSWFSSFVQSLAKDSAAVEASWNADTISEILFAAVTQVPGNTNSAARAAWLDLLRAPRYTTLALTALGPSFQGEVEHLADWWQACPAAERSRELRWIISRAVKLEGEDRIRRILSSRISSFTASLRMAINTAFVKLRLGSFCDHKGAHSASPIRNAAWKRELLLPGGKVGEIQRPL